MKVHSLPINKTPFCSLTFSRGQCAWHAMTTHHGPVIAVRRSGQGGQERDEWTQHTHTHMGHYISQVTRSDDVLTPNCPRHINLLYMEANTATPRKTNHLLTHLWNGSTFSYQTQYPLSNSLCYLNSITLVVDTG